MMLEEFIEIGKVARPQGIRGELKVVPMTDDPKRFLSLENVWLEEGETRKQIRVLSASVRGGDVFLMIDGVSDRNAAEPLRGKTLFVDRANAVPLSEGQAFIADLIGCAVQTEDGDTLGEIIDVLETGANDVFQIKTRKGVLLVPVIESVVVSMEPEDKLVVLNAARLVETSIYQ